MIFGCAMPEGSEGMNVARNIVLLSGLPDSVPGMPVNRFCSSGLETINLGAAEIITGQSEIVVAGGVESMTMVPMGGFRYLPNPRMLEEDPVSPRRTGSAVISRMPSRCTVTRRRSRRLAS